MSPVKKKLLILGSGGLLGSELLSKDYFPDWEVMRHGRSANMAGSADLSNADETFSMLDKLRPNALLNLVGITSVDHCESFPYEAYIGNVKTIENVVAWIKKTGNSIQLIHISTDQVYDGAGPHQETAASLKNYYAFSKYAGELVAASVDAAILRTNFFGKSKCTNRSSLTDWIYSALTEEKSIQVFEDVMFSPLSMETLCKMIALVLNNRMAGIYNLGSRDGLSKADFAYVFAEILGINAKHMTRVASSDVDFLHTYRPKDMRLNVSKFESDAGITLPSLANEVKNAAKEYLK